MQALVRLRRVAPVVLLAAGIAVCAGGALGATGYLGSATPKPIAGDTPGPVVSGQASIRTRHDPSDELTLNVGLVVRNSGQLDALIKAGRVVTNAQYLRDYAPTNAEAGAVRGWLARQGLIVTGTSPDNLLVHVRGRTRDVENAFGITINDYVEHGRAFYANDRDPVVPSDLAVNWVSGLSSYDVFKPALTCANPGPPPSQCSFDGGDLRAIYDIVGDGKGQTIGFTLWGGSLPQSDYTAYANATGTTALTVAGAGDDGLDFIQVDGAGTNSSNTDGEIALDTQNAHGVAPGLHETYWLGKDNTNSTLEDVLNAAANSGIAIISNSWGAQANPCSVDSNMESSLQHGAAVGKTFFFSTGDGGASVGCEYPAESQYVVAVGGTSLSTTAGPAYSSESAVNNGGGCLDSGTMPRPSWQTGIGTPQKWGSPPTSCDGRATPDVAAISGFCTDGSNCGPGTYIYFDGAASCCFGGTSLAAPLWAAASVIWNKTNAGSGRPGIGFVAPLIYALANDATTYANDFHDVTTGTNGFAATNGWDEATGWGSADFNKLQNNVADVTYTGPTQANKGDSITLSATLHDHNAATVLATSALGTLKVSLAADGGFCDANVDAAGNASCGITVTSDPGRYKAIAAYAGDAAYKGGSQTVDFTVLHIPTKLVYTGATSGDYNDPVTLSAKLTDDSNPTSFSSGDPIAGKTVSLELIGGENCSATTDASGVASCTVTPLDVPGPYTVKASFAGDEPVYEPSSASTGFTLKQEESVVAYTGTTTVHYHDKLTATAALTDPDGGAGIPGKTLTFTLGTGETCTSGSTDASGNASCTITATHTGSTTITASFAGDVYYVASGSGAEPFSITPEEATMTYTGPTVILAGASGATLSAKLVEDGANDGDGDPGSAAPNPRETVTLSVGTNSCTGLTSATTGAVSCTIPSITVPLGPQTVKASFTGDAYYQAADDSSTAIVFAFPSSGVFTLGDLTVASATPTTTLSWWSNNWYLLNNLTGGTAPSPFKGFVASVPLPTTTPADVCTGNWSTSGGNSPPPPATVPTYMGVIVASTIAKSGNTIKGAYGQIVVIKTDPGYAPGPHNAGTGTLVATFCSG